MLSGSPQTSLPQSEGFITAPEMPEAKAQPLSILMIEDTASDALLTRIALDATKIRYTLRTLGNGSEALSYIMEHSKFDDIPLPDIILLDLGLPATNGFEILDMLATAPASIRSIPIVILTGYENFEYLSKTSKLFIPAYMTKPCKPEKIREILASVQRARD